MVQRGHILLSLGLYKESREQYQSVLALSPGHAISTKKLSLVTKAESAQQLMVKAIHRRDLAGAMGYHEETLAIASESRLLNFLKVCDIFNFFFL
jgi:hypothetical protein